MPDPQPPRRYRFGTFEADAATGELRRQGLRLKLNAQPFQLLLLFLEHPGQILTRDEIARTLWPDGTFVDFDHGVNSAINRIREVLGDTAGNPRFVETLARRGYRFIAPVELIAAERITAELITAELIAADPAATQPIPASSATPAPPETDARPLHSRILATPDDLPHTPYPVSLTLFLLLQLMYLGFYIAALANLAEIEDLLAPLPRPTLTVDALIVTAAVLIPVRAFLFCAPLFRAPAFHKQFLRLWPGLLVLDILWSLSPLLLLHHINVGLALACTALLVYSPFAQRSLVLMAARAARPSPSTASR